MFERMAGTARLVGLLSLLVALPLLWMAWVLLVNVSSLLLLNERRMFGLLRLRGASGRLLGGVLLVAIGAGGVLGGLLGAGLGTLIPLWIYADGWPGLALMRTVQSPLLLALFILIGVGLSVAVSWRLVRYVSRISPLEASGRVVASESEQAGVRFGWWQSLALLIGAGKVIGWIGGWSLAQAGSPVWLQQLDRGLDFVAFPLFVYGAISLLVSHRAWLAGLLRPLVGLLGGRLAHVSLQHMATRPHRVSGLLLIVALMASLSLYPTVMTAVFSNKIDRAAQVQLGSPLQVTLNVPDLVDSKSLARARSGLAERYALLRGGLEPVLGKLQGLAEVESVGTVAEGLVEGLYMPGYGLGGVPIYLVDDVEAYLADFYHEPALGQTGAFETLVSRMAQRDEVLLSAPLWDYWNRQAGESMPIGRDVDGAMVQAPVAGAVRFMPGIPVLSVNDRDSFISVRIDYLNHMFHNRAYEVALVANPRLARLDVLLPRVMLTVRPAAGVSAQALRQAVLGALPAPPLQVRELKAEQDRLGSDMYIFMARENVRIYLIGGLLMALIGIVAVALSNYAQDRRTLGLLRIRGCGPREIWHFLTANLVAPSVAGLVFGFGVALLVGYGITNLIWQLREMETIMRHLPTRLAVSGQTLAVGGVLIVMILAITLLFSRWVFRKTARE
ncbi:MAG: hypothetical protein ACSLFJ_06550, partial [Immundisolibacter sp.]|uniref:hypothetical protein n=1 Tax=Immundisolibacter sp. TaxID=1934948 RepID=UPI003EE0F6AC